MMKKIMLGVAALAMTAASTLQAQTPKGSEILNLSQYNFTFGTARSAAMGGAFVSLGADLSSMNINPAGLGLYRGSDFGYTPMVTIADMSTHYAGFAASTSKSRFGTGNLGIALNLYQGSGSLTSFTLGFGYNRLADFNYTSSAYAQNMRDTYGQIWGGRLEGVSESVLSQSDAYKAFDQTDIYQWGGVLGYQTGVLDPDPGYTNSYSIFGPSSTYPDRTGPLAANASVNPTQTLYSRGSAGEYNITAGFNFNNRVYMGFGIGIQDLEWHLDNIYEETYNNNDRSLEWMRYDQVTRFRGTGVNVKFGLIVHPVNNLRIGVAVHTPTFMSMQQEYQEYMGARYTGQPYQGLLDSRWLANSYRVNTPTRLMAGLSYAIPGVGLVSVDYERAWYDGMRLGNTGAPGVEADFKREAKEFYRGANNIRAGLELTPTKNFFVRAGYGYYGNNFKYSDLESTNTFDVKSYQTISGGLGFRFMRSFYMDFAYIFTQSTYLPTRIFHYQDPVSGEVWVDSGVIQPKLNRHTILMTLGFKF